MREKIEGFFFWAVVVVLAGFVASGFYFLLRRTITGSFISG